ncbi:MAG: orotidine 5'-phosphate decarboxylase / HUMPS family protein [Candidatus Hadarchaeota archaeon]
MGVILQVALDVLELRRAIEIAEEATKGGADWVEVGTPLIKSEGMNAVRELKKLGYPVIADMKTIDTGRAEVEMAARSGADVVSVLGVSDHSTLMEAVKAARKYGCKVMADLINSPEPIKRAKELEDLGIDYLNVHVGIDQQMTGTDPIEVLRSVLEEVSIPVAVAGGLDAERAAFCASLGATIIIVGSSIVRSSNVTESTRSIRAAVDGSKPQISKKSKEEEIREVLNKVSTPNISDAMHRAYGMKNVHPLIRGTKIVGKAVTVYTMQGDWAKSVEAIDVAEKGEVIVIKTAGDAEAVWGELATYSCLNKGIEGVVIDGAVRDVDDIRKLGYPIFAKREIPNAGESKGFGEINVRIICGGLEVNPGDWIVGDDNGVMVLPKQQAYEIARRAFEVRKHEERVRAEIVEKKRTLAEVSELYKWEKIQ